MNDFITTLSPSKNSHNRRYALGGKVGFLKALDEAHEIAKMAAKFHDDNYIKSSLKTQGGMNMIQKMVIAALVAVIVVCAVWGEVIHRRYWDRSTRQLERARAERLALR